MYAGIQDVRKALRGIGEEVIPDTSENKFSIEQAILKASRMVDLVVSCNFQVPDLVPLPIREITVDLACSFCLEYVFQEQGDSWCQQAQNLYKRSLDMLREIRDGRVSADLLPRSGVPSGLWVAS